MGWIKRQYFKLTSAKSQEVESTSRGEKSTVIVSSFARLANVKTIVETYAGYSTFDEIIVWHNGAGKFEPEVSSDKLRVINSDDLGLASRYAAALLARNETLFLQDDDILAPEATFQTMREKHLQEQTRTVTTEGKALYSDGAYGEVVKPVLGQALECDVHLNRLICTQRSLIPVFFELLHQTNLHLSPQAGGGEDIVYSYAVAYKLDIKPLALGVEYKDLSDENAISKRLGNQHANRTKIVKICQAAIARE